LKTHTVVVMDSGKEYVLGDHPDDFVTRITSDDQMTLKYGFVHVMDIEKRVNVSIAIEHISSVESKTIR
jgi:hypothetical protein